MELKHQGLLLIKRHVSQNDKKRPFKFRVQKNKTIIG